jgi:hypothetical protein
LNASSQDVRNTSGLVPRDAVEHMPQPNDGARIAVLRAEHELAVLEIIAQHLDLSEIGLNRILDALDTIREALELKRPKLGMQQPRWCDG